MKDALALFVTEWCERWVWYIPPMWLVFEVVGSLGMFSKVEFCAEKLVF